MMMTMMSDSLVTTMYSNVDGPSMMSSLKNALETNDRMFRKVLEDFFTESMELGLGTWEPSIFASNCHRLFFLSFSLLNPTKMSLCLKEWRGVRGKRNMARRTWAA